ncbi:glycosyltransferase family 4 protein [Pontibacter mucosus]|nr:glycosyltransferase family 1 protein [Pontibacter mucosus]
MDPHSKKLVVDARMINASGIGTVLQNLLPYLKPLFKLTLLGNPEELKKYEWAADLKVIRFNKPIYSVGEQLALPLLVPHCDFFLSPHFNVPMLPVKAKKRVVLIHDLFHLAANNISSVHKLYAKALLQSAINRSDSIVTISEFSLSEMRRLLKTGSKTIHKISLGVDKSVFYKRQDSSLEAKVIQKYNIPSNYILFVGNVKPHKNLRNLIIAFQKIDFSRFTDLKLVIVGKKEGFITGDITLLHLIKELGLQDRVLFTGFVDSEHLPLIYNLATLFVFPSLYEGFGLPPLEAMATGCPTVVSAAASIPEVCQDASLYFDGTNPEDIASTINLALQDNDLRETLILKGHQLVDQYTWKNSAMALQNIILHQ